MERRDFLASLALLGTQLAACAAAPGAPPPAIAPGHPRLLVGAAEWGSLDARRKADPDLDRFADQLNDGGYVFLGHSETMHNLTTRFRLLGQTVYQKVQ